jgi:hypothetical protein
VLTKAGKYYYELSGTAAPNVSFDPNQALIRGDGSTDYIVTRDGQQRPVRSLQPNGSFKVTKLGKLFFRDKYTQTLVHIPVVIQGQRRNGREYERTDWLPVEALGLGLIRQNDSLSDQDRLRQAKQEVLGRMQVLRTANGRTILLETSGETYSLDRERAHQ